MKWYHWVILVCLGVAGLLIWLYMLGTGKKPGEPGSIEFARQARAMKAAEKQEAEISTEVKDPVLNEPTA